MRRFLMHWLRVPFLGVLCLALLAGCGSSGSSSDDREKPEVQYTGLNGQTAAVMVWVDWRTRTEYSSLQLDLAKALQAKLEPPAEEGETKESKKKDEAAVRLINPGSVVRYQREHPETESKPIMEVAPRLGVARVIYVEVESFDAHAPESTMLLRGRAAATLRVVEVTAGQAKVAFEEPKIVVQYPPGAPMGVVPSEKHTVRTIYDGTIKALAERLAARFAERP
jgi:hypothetical protein